MLGNINDLMNLFQQLQQNPMQLLSMRFNIPQDINIQNPNDIIQHLLNTGQINQSQVNYAMRMKNNPVIQPLLHH